LAVVGGLTREVAAPGWPDLPPDSISDSQAQPWLLPSVFEKVSAGKSDFLSELRPAVALFMQFSGVDYDADGEAEAKLNTFISWVEQVVDQHEGALLQITVGDKGSYLYIAFGVPVAHADDATRAVAAALELQSPSAELSYITGIQIGIGYGQMRAGAYGSPAQRTYGAIGDKTNLAARLMQAAQSRIVCDEATYSAAQEQFDFEPLPPLNEQGKTQLINVYQPLQKRQDTDSASASLVGRAAERALLIDRLSPTDQLALKAASVIGRVFAVGLLRDIYPDEAGKAALDECLESLEDLDLLVRLKQEPLPMYSFKDPLTHETAYNLMLFSQRRQLHRAVAEWHEKTYGTDSLEHYAVLARHWRQAGDLPRAIFYLEKAGEQAQENGEFEAARDFFNELLALATTTR
jgi:class 3 adenylate cyclase